MCFFLFFFLKKKTDKFRTKGICIWPVLSCIILSVVIFSMIDDIFNKKGGIYNPDYITQFINRDELDSYFS